MNVNWLISFIGQITLCKDSTKTKICPVHTKTNHYNLTGHPALFSKCFSLRIRYIEYLGLSLVVYHHGIRT